VKLSKLSKNGLAALAMLMAAGAGGCVPWSYEPRPGNEVAAAPSPDDGDGINAFAPDEVTGVNGSGNPGATGPGGAHDCPDGSGWNAGPRSVIGGAHND
jgi:hypothetical protein